MFETSSFHAEIHHMRFIGTLTKNISAVMPLTFHRKKILEKKFQQILKLSLKTGETGEDTGISLEKRVLNW